MPLTTKTTISMIVLSTLAFGSAANATRTAKAAAEHAAIVAKSPNHPRTEVENRLHNQRHRIIEERHEGELSKDQAQALLARNKDIAHQEQKQAGDGHLSVEETKALNARLNRQRAAIAH